ncbi:MAG: hypothetical protein DLM69_08725 [Candidatus Chloroheliales bacterium]|nr:MAG: hypothetical protein DLM69_08725 [Chloroflexota bacterium]
MANYVLIYNDGKLPKTDAENEVIMAAWVKWFGDIGAALIDAGNPFGKSTAVATDGTVQAGAPSGLTGYTILSADSLDAATAWAKNCPHLSSGGIVEVYETLQVM